MKKLFHYSKVNFKLLIQCAILIFIFGVLIYDCNGRAVEDNRKHAEEVQEKKGCFINPIYPFGSPLKEICPAG